MSVTLRVFDPAMCCSSGVCGPSIDPKLARFAADLEWLQDGGVLVERFNLAQQPAAFAENAPVKQALEAKGEAALPLILLDGQVKSTGTYPSREQLAEWAGVAKPTASLFTEAVSELVAIGAAIASNCEPCFKFHYDKARKLGVSREDMHQAVAVAQNVKDAPARAVSELADRFLRGGASEATPEPTEKEPTSKAASSCCEPKSGSKSNKSKCC